MQRCVFDVLNNVTVGDVFERAVRQTQVNDRRRGKALDVERVLALSAAKLIDRVVAHDRGERPLRAFFVIKIDRHDGMGDLPDGDISKIEIL